MISTRSAVGRAVITAAVALCSPMSQAVSVTPMVSAGGSHNVALKADGTVLTWGSDRLGQLGLGRVVFSHAPRLVQGGSGFKAIASGREHTLALKQDGTVWAWGANQSGSLGDGTWADRSVPNKVRGLANVIAVAAEREYSMALTADGIVWEWGHLPGGPFSPSRWSPVPRRVEGLQGVIAIAAGLAVTSDGRVWAWGYGVNLGQRTEPNPAIPSPVLGIDSVIALTQGYAHVAALKRDGTVWTWGLNNAGQLGDGLPQPEVIGDGLNTARLTPAPVAGLTSVVAIAAGRSHTLALRSDGTVWSWGSNFGGCLGDGSGASSTQARPISALAAVKAINARDNSSFAVMGDGTVKAWGENGYLRLGFDSPESRFTPTVVPSLTGILSISAGDNHSVALGVGNTTWAWGMNTRGELGIAPDLNRSTPAVVPGLVARSISAGPCNTVAVTMAGTVVSWGCSSDYAIEDLRARSMPEVAPGLSGMVAISTGGPGDTVAVREDGTVWHVESASQVVGLSNIVAVSHDPSGYKLALRNDGTVWEWRPAPRFAYPPDPGNPLRQVPGLSDVVAIDASISMPPIWDPEQSPPASQRGYAIKSNGSVWQWSSEPEGPITVVPTPGLASGVAAISRFSLILMKDGRVHQLGSASTYVEGLTSIVAVSAGGSNLALKSDGTVWAWGGGQVGQLGNGTYPFSALNPVVVAAANGAGNLDTNDWFLNLGTGTPAIPPAHVPKVLVTSQLASGDKSVSLDARAKHKAAEFGRKVNVYVLGLVPPAFFDVAKLAPGSATSKQLRDKAGETLILAQLTTAGWMNVQGQLNPYQQGVANAAGSSARILDGIPLEPLRMVPGARFCIGYGESADAMLTAETLRDVLSLDDARGSVSGLPCVLSGVYVNVPASSTAGSAVSLTATVVGASPTGSVQFNDWQRPLTSGLPLVGENAAVAKVSASGTFEAGVHSISARYSGDGQNPAADASPALHTAYATATAAKLSGPVSSAQDDEVLFQAHVAGRNPAGSVQFRANGADLGTAQPLIDGTAMLRVSTLPIGTHSVTAHYGGDGANQPSVSNPFTHQVVLALTSQAVLSTTPNPSTSGTAVRLTASVTGSDPAGTITFRDGAQELAVVSLTAGAASTTIAGLAPGSHVITAEYSGDPANPPVSSNPVLHVVTPAQAQTTPQAFSFEPRDNVVPGASVTSNLISVRGTNAATPIIVSGGSYSIGCGPVFTTTPGAISSGQLVCVRHSASSGPGSTTATTLTIGGVSATFVSTTRTDAFSASVSQLVGHYYASILGRAADAPGEAYWRGEALRVTSLGASVNEAFFALAITFYASPEYLAYNRSDAGFVTDLYKTFFNRPPDSGGLAYWSGELGQGLSREVALAWFMFSSEFVAYARGFLGSSAVRAEVDTVLDFYRGLLGRVPDDGGFDFWVRRFRAAQCQGAAAVISEVEAISRAFAESGEYAARRRNDSQYVGDLYNAFLRRGGDLAGFRFWVGQVSNAVLTRDEVRQRFVGSPEFRARVDAVIAQGCLQ